MIRDKIRAGILDICSDFDRRDRFAFFIGRLDIGINYVKSVGMNEIKIGRGFVNVEGTNQRLLTELVKNVTIPNRELFKNKCVLGLLSRFSDSVESDVCFTVKRAIACKEEIWRPELIHDRPDVYLESVILSVETEKGFL